MTKQRAKAIVRDVLTDLKKKSENEMNWQYALSQIFRVIDQIQEGR